MNKESNVALPSMMDKPEFAKAILALHTAAAKVQTSIQLIGTQALMHLQAHGDIGSVNRLFLGLPKGVRKTALVSWLLAHGALKVNTDIGTKATSPMVYDKDKATNAGAAWNDPWQDHMPEKAIDEVFDLSKALAMIVKKCEGKQIKVGGQLLSVEDAKAKIAALTAYSEVK